MTTIAAVQLPVLVEVPVNHETFRPISEALRTRIDQPLKSIEEITQNSQRNSARSHRLRDAHLNAIKERAARDIQVPRAPDERTHPPRHPFAAPA